MAGTFGLFLLSMAIAGTVIFNNTPPKPLSDKEKIDSLTERLTFVTIERNIYLQSLLKNNTEFLRFQDSVKKHAIWL